MVYQLLVCTPLQKRVRPWRIWHQALLVLGLVLFIGICNFLLFSFGFHHPIRLDICLAFLYWTLIIGVIITALSTGISYFRFLRGQLDSLLDKTTEQQQGLSVTIHDTRVRGNDLTLPVNELLYIEAQKNNVAVYFLKDGKMAKDVPMGALIGESLAKLQQDSSPEAFWNCVAELKRIDAMAPGSAVPKYYIALQSLNFAVMDYYEKALKLNPDNALARQLQEKFFEGMRQQ